MYKTIKAGILMFPNERQREQQGIAPFSDDCKDFIQKLLTFSPDQRLGSNGDVDEVLSHPWLQVLDRDAILNKTIEAPAKPKLSDDVLNVDTLDKQFTEEEAKESTIPDYKARKVERLKEQFECFASDK